MNGWWFTIVIFVLVAQGAKLHGLAEGLITHTESPWKLAWPLFMILVGAGMLWAAVKKQRD